MTARVLLAVPEGSVDQAQQALRTHFDVTVETDAVRALALARLRAFQCFVTSEAFLDLSQVDATSPPHVLLPRDGLVSATVLDLVATAVEARIGFERRQASSFRHLASLRYQEVLDHARYTATREYLLVLLELHRGSVTDAARAAGLVRESLHRLLRRHDLDAETFRSRSEPPSDG